MNTFLKVLTIIFVILFIVNILGVYACALRINSSYLEQFVEKVTGDQLDAFYAGNIPFIMILISAGLFVILIILLQIRKSRANKLIKENKQTIDYLSKENMDLISRAQVYTKEKPTVTPVVNKTNNINNIEMLKKRKQR